jgi:hypothetical protein
LNKNKWRGKTWDGKWIFGFPVCLTEENYDDGIYDGIQSSFGENQDIDSETLGQCTCVDTKDKKFIFEGDKIIWNQKEWHVKWNEDFAGYIIDRSMFYHGENAMKKLDCDIAFESTIIGTIFDK